MPRIFEVPLPTTMKKSPDTLNLIAYEAVFNVISILQRIAVYCVCNIFLDNQNRYGLCMLPVDITSQVHLRNWYLDSDTWMCVHVAIEHRYFFTLIGKIFHCKYFWNFKLHHYGSDSRLYNEIYVLRNTL